MSQQCPYWIVWKVTVTPKFLHAARLAEAHLHFPVAVCPHTLPKTWACRFLFLSRGIRAANDGPLLKFPLARLQKIDSAGLFALNYSFCLLLFFCRNYRSWFKGAMTSPAERSTCWRRFTQTSDQNYKSIRWAGLLSKAQHHSELSYLLSGCERPYRAALRNMQSLTSENWNAGLYVGKSFPTVSSNSLHWGIARVSSRTVGFWKWRWKLRHVYSLCRRTCGLAPWALAGRSTKSRLMEGPLTCQKPFGRPDLPRASAKMKKLPKFLHIIENVLRYLS